MNPIIVLKAIDKRTNTILFTEGLEDTADPVQVIVPSNVYTEVELEYIKKEYKVNTTRKLINLGNDVSANLLVCDLTHLKIEIVYIDLKDIVFVPKYDDSLITVLTATNKETKEIIFAEGTDPDGYGTHLITIDKALISDTEVTNDLELFLVKNLLSSYHEAKDLIGDYKKFSIELQHFKIY